MTTQDNKTMLDNADLLYREKKYAVALRIYKLLAEKGYTDCQVQTGWMYFAGEGSRCDYEEAVGNSGETK